MSARRIPQNQKPPLVKSPAAVPRSADGLPLTYHDVMIALGKAKAALRLLEAIDNGDLEGATNWSNEDVHDNLIGWWEDMCYSTLRESLHEAEVAFMKSQSTAEKAVA